VVRDEWIDENNHFNSAMYFVAFRDVAAMLFHAAALDCEAARTRSYSIVQRESHIRYVRELRRGDPLLMRAWVAGIDRRSVHVVGELMHGNEGWQAAVIEQLGTCFDRLTRKSMDWPSYVAERLSEIQRAGADTLPAQDVGQRIALRALTSRAK
jgi:acyl-CoA thioester hydrolase